MCPRVAHPNLRKGFLEARAYQLEGVAESLQSSTLLVYPTAGGKTAVAVMAMAETLHRDKGAIVIIAPTVGLVDQHQRTISEWLVSDFESVSLTGSTPPAKREQIWKISRIVVTTPQIYRNDVLSGLVVPSDISLLIIDEAHHAVGNHAMALSADLHMENGGERILAMTASPGFSRDHVRSICNRLSIDRIHLRSSDDPMMKEYLSDLDIVEIRVDVPNELLELAAPIRGWQRSIVDVERRLGRYVHEGAIGYAGLSSAMERAQAAIRRGDGTGYASMSRIALAMTLNHLINHLLSQGVAAAREFLRRKSVDSDSKKKSSRDLLKDRRIRSLIEKLDDMREVHSKIGSVRRLVAERLRRNRDGKIIIFATYRDTVSAIHQALSDISGAHPVRFVGQANRGESGLSSGEQIETINSFREGHYNILVATSVGEEGLDIPSADLVIFYEPVGSETRTIQRRGRTGRRRQGDVVVLIAEGTRDEGAVSASLRRELAMKRSIHSVRRLLTSGPIDYSLLDSFTVDLGVEFVKAEFFISEERGRHAVNLSEERNPARVIDDVEEEVSSLSDPSSFRPRGQFGLEDFKR